MVRLYVGEEQPRWQSLVSVVQISPFYLVRSNRFARPAPPFLLVSSSLRHSAPLSRRRSPAQRERSAICFDDLTAAQRSCKDFSAMDQDPLDSVAVRFHYRGTFEYRTDLPNEFSGGEWIYKGGRSSMSTVLLSKLSLPELKKHLGDHVSISEELMAKTDLCWKIPSGPMRTALVRLNDQKSVLSMASHATDAGVVDVYAKIPVQIDPSDISDENTEHRQANAVKLPLVGPKMKDKENTAL